MKIDFQFTVLSLKPIHDKKTGSWSCTLKIKSKEHFGNYTTRDVAQSAGLHGTKELLQELINDLNRFEDLFMIDTE